MKKKKKWYDEEYEFTVEVTGFLHVEKPKKNTQTMSKKLQRKYGKK